MNLRPWRGAYSQVPSQYHHVNPSGFLLFLYCFTNFEFYIFRNTILSNYPAKYFYKLDVWMSIILHHTLFFTFFEFFILGKSSLISVVIITIITTSINTYSPKNTLGWTQLLSLIISSINTFSSNHTPHPHARTSKRARTQCIYTL